MAGASIAVREPIHRLPAVQWGVIVTVVLQLAAMVWFASDANTRLREVEKELAEQRAIPERVTRLEADLAHIKASLTNLDAKMDRLLQRQTASSSDDLGAVRPPGARLP